jgi:hypothetical protein
LLFQESAWRFAGEGEGVHAEGAEDVDLAGGGDEVFAHHAHDGAGDDAEELLDGGPALDGGDGERAGLHPAVDDGAELGHLHEGGVGGVADGNVLLDGGELGLGGVVMVGHAADAAHDLTEVEGFDGDAGLFKELFGVADGVESGRARADGAETDVAQAADDAADGGEPAEVRLELGRVGGLGVQLGERVGDAVLLEVVADGHLSAEAVAAEGDGHLAGVVGRGLDEDGDLEVGETEGVGEAALFPEVGQGDDDAVDLGGVLFEQSGALLGVLVALDGAVGGLLGAQDDRLDAGGFERGDHLEPATGREVAGKEAAVSYDYTHCHLLCHDSPVAVLLVKVGPDGHHLRPCLRRRYNLGDDTSGAKAPECMGGRNARAKARAYPRSKGPIFWSALQKEGPDSLDSTPEARARFVGEYSRS